MRDSLGLELAALRSVANLAAIDIPAAMAQINGAGVQSADFASAHVAAVWSVVEAMVRDGRAPDFYAVGQKCPGVPQQVLKEALLSRDMAPPAERLAAVRDAGKRRRTLAALDTVREVVADSSRSNAEAATEVARALEMLGGQDGGAATLDADVFPFLDHLDEVDQGRRESVLETGIEALDSVIGGLQPTLTVIGSLPGVGKSALLAGIVRNLVARGVKVGVFSLEDERRWILTRLTAELSGVPVFVLQNRKLTPSQKERVQKALEVLHPQLRSAVVDDRPALSTADVIASAREMVSRHGAKAIILDHLGEIRLQRTDRHDLDIIEALQQLRALAKVYRIPVVVACHLRRRDGLGPADEPKLTDFAFSAGVERMARVALALSRPSEDIIHAHVLKQTNGIANVGAKLDFLGPAGVVKNAEAPDTRSRIDARYGDRP